MVVACDGSVRFLTYSISTSMFHRFGRRADGNIVNLP
jgi:hypothetical protein